ncbi:MAG: hypothetical protein WC627_07690 [Legionella sp.]|jgi:hypothetical protein
MSDFKSKLPDLQELSSMTGKLFKGIKASVDEIIHDYKEKRANAEVVKESKEEVAEAKKEAEVKKEEKE